MKIAIIIYLKIIEKGLFYNLMNGLIKDAYSHICICI